MKALYLTVGPRLVGCRTSLIDLEPLAHLHEQLRLKLRSEVRQDPLRNTEPHEELLHQNSRHRRCCGSGPETPLPTD